MEFIIFLFIIFAIVLYAMVRGAIDEKKERARYRLGLKNNYGKFQTYRHTKEEFSRIAGLYDRSKADYDNLVDDITWSDLNMDGIFDMMDYAQSSAGEEYLYCLLRHPRLSDMDGYFDKLEKEVDAIMGDESKRLDTMMALNELGKCGKYSLYDYMDFLDNIARSGNAKHYACIVMLVLSIAAIFFNTSLGVLLVILVACINVAIYLRDKGKISPYVATFSYILRMMKCRDRLIGLGFKGTLCDNSDKFKGFERHSGMVLSMNESVGSLWGVFFEYIKMLTHVDIIRFNNMLEMVQKNEQSIFELSYAIGHIDATICIAYFRRALEYYCVPNLSPQGVIPFSIKEGFHPSVSNHVPNGFSQNRGMLITGSNASGKSTFLRMTALNAVLAQTIHTCAAKSYSGAFYRVYTSMALSDDLENGDSYYIVEIKAMKRIMDAVAGDGKTPVLCFIDEVLRGTNTVERIAASTQILDKLARGRVLCFAATHDIELCQLLEDKYDNYHFEEEVKEGDVIFSYHLLKGKAKTRNAIKLLEIIGFSEEIVDRANDMAQNFIEKGEWRS